MLVSPRITALALFVALAPPSAPAAGAAHPQASGGGGMTTILHHEVVRLAGIPPTARPFTTTVRLGGRDVRLDLQPHSLRADDFRVLVPAPDGSLSPVAAPAPRTLRGVAEGFPGSLVAGALVEGGLSARIQLAPGELWLVEPESALRAGAPRSRRHVVYRGSDVLPDRFGVCGTLAPSRIDPRPAGEPAPASTGNVVAEIACDADFEFFQRNGDSVPATVLDIEDILNRTEAIFDSEVDAVFELTTIVVRDDILDPYVSPEAQTLLNEFRDEWNGNPDLANKVRRDIAQLFTGKDLLSNTIGIAWVGVVCDNPTSGLGYSAVQSRYQANKVLRTCLSAHEIGHNFNAGHCNGNPGCAIMCSGINGCGGGCTTFGPDAEAQIVAHRATRACLATEEEPLSAPFFEPFPTAALDPARWSYVDGAEVRSEAEGEPSAPFALDLDATGAGPHLGDEVRTGFLLLSGSSSPEVSCMTQHRGVEAGEELAIEYRNDSLAWVELDRVTSDGTDQDTFEHRRLLLPPDALHDGFRLRLRPEVDEDDDEWYVDNLAVGELRDLFVATTPVAAAISVSPSDLTGFSTGTAPLARLYLDGQQVTLSAPSSAGGGRLFERWTLDGIPQPRGKRTLVVTMEAARSAVAHYRAVHREDRETPP